MAVPYLQYRLLDRSSSMLAFREGSVEAASPQKAKMDGYDCRMETEDRCTMAREVFLANRHESVFA